MPGPDTWTTFNPANPLQGMVDAILGSVRRPPWNSRLVEAAEEPAAPTALDQPLGDFVSSTLSDPNWLNKLGLPLGLLGRALDWEQETFARPMRRQLADPLVGVRTAGPLLGPILSGLARDVVPGGQFLVEQAFSPSTYLTLGAGPGAKIGAAIARTGLPGAARAGQAFEAINRASDLPFRGARAVARPIVERAKELPAFQVSSESKAREIVNKFRTFVMNLRDEGYMGSTLRAETLGRHGTPPANAWRAVGNLHKQFEDSVNNAPDVLVKAYGSLVNKYARATLNEYRRQLEVGRYAALQEGDKAAERLLYANYFDQSMEVLTASRQALADFSEYLLYNEPIITVDDATRQRVAGVIDKYGALVDDVLTKAKEEAEEVRKFSVDPNEVAATYQARDAAIVQLTDDMTAELDEVFDQLAPSRGEGWMSTLLGPQAADQFMTRLRNLKLNAEGLLTARSVATSDEDLRSINRLLSTAEATAQRFMADKRELFDILRRATNAAPDNTLAEVLDLLKAQGIGAELPPGAYPFSNEIVDGLARLARAGDARLDAKDMSRLRALVEKWHRLEHDLITGDPLLAAEKAVYEATLSGLGGGVPRIGGTLGRGFDVMSQWWKELALMSPRYLSQNAAWALGAMARMGYDPVDAGRRMVDTLKRWRTSKNPDDWLPASSAEFIRQNEWRHPAALVTGAHVVAQQSIDYIKSTASERIPPLVRAAVGAAVGMGGGPVGSAIGAYLAWKSPAAATLSRNLSWIIEQSVRMPIYEEVFRQHVAQAAPSFLDRVAQVARTGVVEVAHDVAGTTRQAWTLVDDPFKVRTTKLVTRRAATAEIDEALQELAARQGRFGHRTLNQTLTRMGIPTDARNALIREWTNIQGQASRAGLDASNAIHFDYSTITNIEEFLKQYVPFATWALRAMPWLFDRLAENPAVALAVVRYYQNSHREMQEAGVPASYLGYQPLRGAIGQTLATIMTGRPGNEVWINPLQLALGPFGEAVRAPTRIQDDDSPVEAALEMARSVGLAPSGLLEYAASASGLGPAASRVFGGTADQPIPNLWRYSDVVGGLLGRLRNVGTNTPFQGALDALLGAGGFEAGGLLKELPATFRRQALGQDPFSYRQLAIERRLDEMSMEEVGKVGDAAYMAAKSDPNSPLYRRAAADVAQREILQGLLASTVPIPTRALTDTEAAVRKQSQIARAEAGIEGAVDTPEEKAAYAAAVEARPISAAYANSSGQRLQAEIKRGLAELNNPVLLFPDSPPDVRRYMEVIWADYQARSSVRGANVVVTNPLLRLMLQRRQTVLDNHPLLREYLLWRAEQHPGSRTEGEDPLIEQFLRLRQEKK